VDIDLRFQPNPDRPERSAQAPRKLCSANGRLLEGDLTMNTAAFSPRLTTQAATGVPAPIANVVERFIAWARRGGRSGGTSGV
jgi:hypothetical protein